MIISPRTVPIIPLFLVVVSFGSKAGIIYLLEHVPTRKISPLPNPHNAANNNDCTTSSSNVSSSSNCINPTNFYQDLSLYNDNFSPLDNNNNNNKHNTRRKNALLAINTNNVGDAAMVFQCLVGALETSVKDKV